MITETQAEQLGVIITDKIDMEMPIQQLFDECLKFVSIADFLE